MTDSSRSPEVTPEFSIDPLLDRHDLGYLFRRYWKLFLVVPALCGAIGLAAFVAKPTLYESSALLMIDSSLDQLLQFEQVGRGGETVRESLKSIEVALVADSVVLRVVDRLGLRDEPGFLPEDLAGLEPLPDGKLLEFLRKKRIRASLQPETRLIRIGVLDTEPERARLIAETFLDEFESFLADQRRNEVSEVRSAIEQQAAEAKAEAIAAEERLKKFQKETGILPVQQDQDLFAERISQFGTDLNTASRKRVEMEGLHQSLESLDPTQSPIEIIEVAGYRNDAHVSTMLTALANSRSRLAAARERYTPTHPELLSAQAEVDRNIEEIEEMARGIQSTTEARYASAARQEELLRSELSGLEGEYFEAKAQASQLRALQEETENLWRHYQSLQKRLSDNIISTEMPGNIATVISDPLTPYTPAGTPWILFVLVGGLFGFVVVGLFVSFRIVAGIPFTDRRQLEEAFAHPVLADWSDGKAQGDLSGALLPFLVRSSGQLVHISAPGLSGVVEPITQRLASTLASTGRQVLVIEAREGVAEPSIMETSTPGLSRLEISPEDLYDESRFASVLPRIRETYDLICLEAGSQDQPLLLDWLSHLCDREIVVVGRNRACKEAIRKRIRRMRGRDGFDAGFLFVDPNRISASSLREGTTRDSSGKAPPAERRNRFWKRSSAA